jgi:hypothetical protein
MNRGRVVAAVVLAAVALGSLSVTVGYAIYWRSAAYRAVCAGYLTEALGLPADIGRVVPRSMRVREFNDVTIWLPDRRDRAFTCARALVRYLDNGAPDDYEIELIGGACEMSTRTWLRDDYRALFERTVRSGFAPDGPRRVHFRDMDIRFERDGFALALDDATGQVWFESEQTGQAAISCRRFNGQAVATPVHLNVAFSAAGAGAQIDELELLVPPLPLALLGLDRLLGGPVESGTFEGRVQHRESAAGRATIFSGRCENVVLGEWTAGWLGRRWRGRCAELELQELRLEDDRLARLRFRGVVTDVAPDDVLALADLPPGGGTLTLRVRQADLSPAGVDLLIASAACTGFDLERFTGDLGLGRMSGEARATIADLTIEHNRIASLRGEVRVPAGNGPRWIEGALLQNATSHLLGLNLPVALPERVEYRELGVRAEVRDEVLHVRGTHGPRERTILTVLLQGVELPLVFAPQRPIELSPYLDPWRDRAAAELARQRWLRRTGAPATAPAMAPAADGG